MMQRVLDNYILDSLFNITKLQEFDRTLHTFYNFYNSSYFYNFPNAQCVYYSILLTSKKQLLYQPSWEYDQLSSQPEV